MTAAFSITHEPNTDICIFANSVQCEVSERNDEKVARVFEMKDAGQREGKRETSDAIKVFERLSQITFDRIPR